jgi:hypothetical protein
VSGRPSKLTLLQPKWLLLHVITLAVCGAMIWLGHWQWRAAIRRGDDLRNYAYALQWWAFVGFTVLMWFRIVHDHLRPDRHAKAREAKGRPAEAIHAEAIHAEAAELVTPDVGAQASGTQPAGAQHAAEPASTQPPASRYRGYTPPPLPDPDLETDPERRRLNAYLARLSAADREAAE